ncbi:hypothetical protein VTI74DRAFT_6497 [Chaetomium olivicolor]
MCLDQRLESPVAHLSSRCSVQLDLRALYLQRQKTSLSGGEARVEPLLAASRRLECYQCVLSEKALIRDGIWEVACDPSPADGAAWSAAQELFVPVRRATSVFVALPCQQFAQGCKNDRSARALIISLVNGEAVQDSTSTDPTRTLTPVLIGEADADPGH